MFLRPATADAFPFDHAFNRAFRKTPYTYVDEDRVH